MTQSPKIKVLFPIDIVHLHPEYLEPLKELLPLADISINLLYVREELPAFETTLSTMADFPQDLSHQIDNKAKEVLTDFAAKLKPLCAEVTTEIVSGPPALMIESVAKDDNYDLVVISPGTHSKVEAYLLGSTTERVVKHADTAVLILRLAKGVCQFKNVVIGVDGSDESSAALLQAVKLFGLDQRDVQVTVVNVVSVTGIFKYISPASFVASIEDNLMMSGEAILAQTNKVLKDCGVKKVETKLADGDPVTELLKVVAELQADLVVVGGQGRSALERFLLGGVSSKLATHAPCSTAVFKRLRAQ
jgi:nucleotide-binding universal stress UspA family protein